MASYHVLLVDNYDSYTFNLFQLFARILGCEPVVIRNDQISWSQLAENLSVFDAIVISPGPGRPDQPKDFGVCAQLLNEAMTIPILGVCLGHQGLAFTAGGVVEHAPEVRHGRLSCIKHNQSGLFEKLPSPFKAVRYHSLRVANPVPDTLEVLAWSDGDDSIMALRHKDRPHYGVQFHPESICTEHGEQLVSNFIKLAHQHNQYLSRSRPSESEFQYIKQQFSILLEGPHLLKNQELPSSTLTINVDKVSTSTPSLTFTSRLFDDLFANKVGAFWLDSAKVERGISRFSFMGCWEGPLGALLEYDLASQSVQVTLPASPNTSQRYSCTDSGFLGWLRDYSSLFRTTTDTSALVTQRSHLDSQILSIQRECLPFDFCGGWVGYLAYDLKDECADLQTSSNNKSMTDDALWSYPPSSSDSSPSASAISSKDVHELESPAHASVREDKVPAATFIIVDRFIAYDHETGAIYIVSVDPTMTMSLWGNNVPPIDPAQTKQSNKAWRTFVCEQVQALVNSKDITAPAAPSIVDRKTFRNHLNENDNASPDVPEASIPITITLALPHQAYKTAIEASLVNIADGESYELDPYRLYQRLRRDNPAPYAAYFRPHHDFAMASSSPERFTAADDDISPHHNVESKPIKGTARRGATAEEDDAIKAFLKGNEKEFSENLMIVDLLRNDLGKVCQTGSVQVPSFMSVETYTSMHQLVSTVTGTLREGVTSFDCVQQCFPPGSMTGAPKRRTMEIIDALENVERGVYSGVFGFFSFNGAADLAVVIRTAIVVKDVISVGAGGAIVALSDVEEEYEEMILKASSVWPSICAEILQQSSEE